MNHTFLVERYWPDVTRETLAAALEGVLTVQEDMAREGRFVHHLRTTLIPADDAVFSFFQAGSPADVAELNRRAGIPFDRIAEAISIEGDTEKVGGSGSVVASAPIRDVAVPKPRYPGRTPKVGGGGLAAPPSSYLP
jgi:hypothetical protein